jgi:hypothetical protein
MFPGINPLSIGLIAGQAGSALSNALSNAHTGSMGTPDLGISEGIQSALNALGGNFQNSSQGGSNLFGGSGGQTQNQSNSNTQQGPVYNGPVSGGSGGGSYSSGGSNNSNNSNVAVSSGPSPQEIASQRERAIRDAIENGFSTIMERLSKLEGDHRGAEQEDIARLGVQAGELKTGADNALTANKQKLDGYRGDVDTRSKSSINKLAGDMRNMLQAGQIMLGSRGAGDSSASDMYSYALGKQANQGRAEIYRGRDQQMGALDQKSLDLETAYNDSIRDIGKWEFENVNAVKDRTRQLLERLTFEKNNADSNKMAALVRMEEGLLQQAQNQVNALMEKAGEARILAQQQAQTAYDGFGTSYNQMGTNSNYQVQDMGFTNLDGTLRADGPQASSQQQGFYNPYAVREEEQNTSSLRL